MGRISTDIPPEVDFQQAIQIILQDSLLKQSQIGIKISSLDSGDVIFESNNHLLFHPASNMKLFTTGVALKKLGPDFLSHTLLLTDTFYQEQHFLNSNLYLKGLGNSTFNDEDLELLGNFLHTRGIRKINGNIICDISAFDNLYRGKGWSWDDDSAWEYAPISALSINENCVKISISPGQFVGDSVRWRCVPRTSYVTIINDAKTVEPADSINIQQFRVFREWVIPKNNIYINGGVAIHTPDKNFRLDVVDAAMYAGIRLKEILASFGVEVTGQVLKGKAGLDNDTLLVFPSLPLRDLISDINKNSNNFASEMLLKNLGAYCKGYPGTADKGLSVIRELTSDLGIDSTVYKITDGSGVSRYNLLTVDLIVEFLKYMYQDQQIRDIYKSSLAIAGKDGELKDRMHNGEAFQRIYGKTGTLQGVSVLSGYASTQSGENVVFSMMMQHFVVPVKEIRLLQDKIAHLIVTFDRRKDFLRIQPSEI